MNVILDDVALNIIFDTEKNVGDVLKALEKELESNSATMIEVKADNIVVSAEKLEELFLQPLGNIKELSIKSISYMEVKEILKQLCKVFNTLSEKLEKIPVQLQKDANKEAMTTVSELADSLSLLFQIIPYLELFTKFSNVTVENKSLMDFIQEFPPFLQDFLKAVESNDTVSIGDLAEYEIAPRLKSLSLLQKVLEQL